MRDKVNVTLQLLELLRALTTVGADAVLEWSWDGVRVELRLSKCGAGMELG